MSSHVTKHTIDLERAYYPVSAMRLSKELRDIFQETGAKTVADTYCQVEFSCTQEDTSVEHWHHLRWRLTAAQKKQVLDECARIAGLTNSDLATFYFSEESAPWRAEILRDALPYLQAGFDKEEYGVESGGPVDMFRVGDLSKGMPGVVPFDDLPQKSQELLLAMVSWCLMDQMPDSVPFRREAWDLPIAIYCYGMHYNLPYALRILRESEPGLTMEELKRRRISLVVRIAVVAYSFLRKPYYRSMSEARKELPDRGFGELEADAWHIQALRSMFPEYMDQWEMPDMPFYDVWVKSVLWAVLDDMEEARDGTEIFWLGLRPTDDDMAPVAMDAKIPLHEYKRILDKVRASAKSEPVRQLLLGGCPFGTRAEWELFRQLDFNSRNKLSYLDLRLSMELRTSLFDVLQATDITALACLLWPEPKTWAPLLRSELGEYLTIGLRAYLYYLGLGSAMKTDARRCTCWEGQFAVFFTDIMCTKYPNNRFSKYGDISPQEMANGMNIVKRCLLGYTTLPDYDASRENFFLFSAQCLYRLTGPFTRRLMDRMGFRQKESLTDFFLDTCGSIAPEAYKAVKGVRSAKSRGKEPAEVSMARLLCRPVEIELL